MSRRVPLGLAAGLICLTGCRVGFDVHASGVATIQGGSLLSSVLRPLGPLDGLTDFDITQTQDFKNQGISKSQVESVKLKSMTLSITSPSGETFDFLSSIAFEVGADGQPTVTIGQSSPVPMGVSTFDLGVDDVQLLPYVAAPAMSVTANASGQPPPQDTTIDVAAVFSVSAKP